MVVPARRGGSGKGQERWKPAAGSWGRGSEGQAGLGGEVVPVQGRAGSMEPSWAPRFKSRVPVCGVCGNGESLPLWLLLASLGVGVVV